MKKRLLQLLAGGATIVFGWIDRVFTGSYSGMTAEQQVNNPYKSWGILRSRDRVLRSYRSRGWLVLGFEEAQALLKDTRFSTDIRKNNFLSKMIRVAADGRPVSFIDNPALLNVDQPHHTRSRKLAQQGFLHKHIQSLEPEIELIVEQCLNSYDSSTGFYDIVQQLAEPLPAIVIAKMLGLPDEDLEEFQDMSARLLGLSLIGNNEKMDAGANANAQLLAYFKRIIEQKRLAPSQDLISRFIAAEEEGDRLTVEEVNSMCVFLLIAGQETTTRLIGNGMYTLLCHPDQLAMLKRDPALTPNAVEEMLRFEPPVQTVPRFAIEDTEFYGKKIRKNQILEAVIASANRDPAANQNPDQFDITRKNIKHVSFGYGIHLCLGMSLARLEAKIAINLLLDRFPEMQMIEQKIEWSPIPIARGVENLVIATNSGQTGSPQVSRRGSLLGGFVDEKKTGASISDIEI